LWDALTHPATLARAIPGVDDVEAVASR
jgi:carbon monoxide dehydrogenase subunit G